MISKINRGINFRIIMLIFISISIMFIFVMGLSKKLYATDEINPVEIEHIQPLATNLNLSSITWDAVSPNSNSANVGVAYDYRINGVVFRWELYDLKAEKWSLISDWSTSNWASFKDLKAGKYWINVSAKAPDGTMQNSTIAWNVSPLNIALSGIASNAITPNSNGANVGIAYDYRLKDIQFRWEIYNVQTGKWSLISDYNASNWTSFRGLSPGSYWINVYAKAPDGTVQNYIFDWNVTVPTIGIQGLATSSVSSNNSSANIGVAYDYRLTRVTLQWRLYNLQTKQWSLISDWNSSNWTSIRNLKPGQYWINVLAKAPDGLTQEYTTTWTVNSYTVSLQPLLVQSINALTNNFGVPYSTNDPNVTFVWQVLDYSTGLWSTIGTGKSNWVTWKSNKYGQYLVHVTAVTSSGYTDTSYTNWSLYKRDVQIQGMMAQAVSTYGAVPIYNIGVSYTSNDVYQLFRWKLYNVATDKWSLLTNWSASNWSTVSVNPGNYWLCVEAMNSVGEIVSKTIGFTSYKSVHPFFPGNWVEVNLSEQKSYLMSGSTVIYEFVISSGLLEPTPTGEFFIQRKKEKDDMRGDWGIQPDVPNVAYFTNQGHALHGAYWHSQFGVPQSHGCINYKVPDSKIMYDFVKIGTRVYIHY